MNPPDVEVTKSLPGVAGALVSLLFVKDRWPRRICMFLAGAVLARYATPWLMHMASFDQGFSGFLLGMFGMVIVKKAFEAWEAIELTLILRDWIRKIAGVPVQPQATRPGKES